MKKIGHGPPQNMRGNLKMQDNGNDPGAAAGHLGHLGHVTTIAQADPARA